MSVPSVILDRLVEEFPDDGAKHVGARLSLFENDATVPFVARYRKEATGGMDEVRIRQIRDRAVGLIRLEERRAKITDSLKKREIFTPELAEGIAAAKTRTELEDLYLPYRPKRETRATKARERGLEPLARAIQAGELELSLDDLATPFVNAEKEVATAADAIAGAMDILADEIAIDPEARRTARARMAEAGVIVSTLSAAKLGQRSKYEPYYEYREELAKIPSHRFLAVRRGEKEGWLDVKVELDASPVLGLVQSKLVSREDHPYRDTLLAAADDSWNRLLGPAVRRDVLDELKHRSDAEAIGVFARNLRDLLLAPPAGSKTVLGVDPGQKSGCKLIVVDPTGKALAHATIQPHEPKAQPEESRETLLGLIREHGVELIAIGNGTASRETDGFVRKSLAGAEDVNALRVIVSEAGASVYSASRVAREEFPDLDVTLRGAVSIARRLQDPLPELVKIEPRSIGVGQYQHDVHQKSLDRSLAEVVESCVNRVGVDLNTASPSLLARVAGVGPKLAHAIVAKRDTDGPYRQRSQLMEIERFGDRTFEQAAGFLRLRDGENALDATAIHPERYELVEKMATSIGVGVADLIRNSENIGKLDADAFVDENVGRPTIDDILVELARPGRDPRATFEVPHYRDDVTDISDLKEGMVLEGRVANVARFGAFVDLGIHQDGLVHISEMSRSFVRDPSELLRVGQTVKVKVLAVDAERKRISLSMKAAVAPPPPKRPRPAAGGAKGGPKKRSPRSGSRAPARGSRKPQRVTSETPRPSEAPIPESLSEEERYARSLAQLKRRFGR